MGIIKKWKEQVESLDKLKIEEAKELYIKAINSSDEHLKKLYIDKVILGTLYLICNHIDRNHLEILQSSQYDIEDIQSAFTEVWIRKIKNGELLNVDEYSSMFNSTFFNDVYKSLVGNEMVINKQFGITVEPIIDLFYSFIKLKNTGKEFNFDDLMTAVYQEKSYYWQKVSYCPRDNILMLLLENMYNNLNFDKTEDLKITKNKIGDYIKLFINNGLYEKISNNIAADDCIDNILNSVMYEGFIDDVDDVITDERKRKIIHERYGLDGDEPKTLTEIAEQFGVTGERIRQIEARSLRDLRKSRKIRKYVK